MLEKRLVHELVIALRMIRWQPYVLVEIERGHPAEIEFFLAVHANEFAVQHQRRTAGGEAQHGIRLALDLFGHQSGGDATGLFGVR